MAPRAPDVVEIEEERLAALSYHDLRVLGVSLGVLVQDNPNPDVLRARIRQCEQP